jgi:hypothetical protein
MNKALLEKVSAIREDLLALRALVPPDAKIVYDEQGMMVPFQNNPHIQNLADLGKQKVPLESGLENVPMWRNYQDLAPYMTADQKDRVPLLFALGSAADTYLRTGKDNLTGHVVRFIPLLLADLDEIQKSAASNPKTETAT